MRWSTAPSYAPISTAPAPEKSWRRPGNRPLARRKRVLDSLGGIEATAFLRVGGETIHGVPEANADRATAEGKASSVQFVHFPFTAEQIATLFSPNAGIVIGFSHRNYGHMAVLPEAVRAELTTDFG